MKQLEIDLYTSQHKGEKTKLHIFESSADQFLKGSSFPFTFMLAA